MYYLNKRFKSNKIIQNEWNIGYRGNIKVIGDIHGDFNVLIKSLKKAKVINNKHRWIGGKTHIVQVGDIIDRGGRPGVITTVSDPMEEYKIYEFLNNLEYSGREGWR